MSTTCLSLFIVHDFKRQLYLTDIFIPYIALYPLTARFFRSLCLNLLIDTFSNFDTYLHPQYAYVSVHIYKRQCNIFNITVMKSHLTYEAKHCKEHRKAFYIVFYLLVYILHVFMSHRYTRKHEKNIIH